MKVQSKSASEETSKLKAYTIQTSMLQLSAGHTIIDALDCQEKLQTQLVGQFHQCFCPSFLKEPVYCELPKLYDSTDGSDGVLKFYKSLYGLV